MAGSACFVFDLASCQDRQPVVSCLKAILGNGKIEKVLHACAQDSAVLLYQLGITLAEPIFDTQVPM